MRKVLIVSPHFPPINAPDHQRVRTALPFLAENDWNATILTVAQDAVEGFCDPLLEKALPLDTRVERVIAIPVRWTRWFGLGNLALRALPFLWHTGNRLLTREKFDLVFFSTTVFPVTVLGPVWKRRFQVPYVIDFQDPWLDDSYRRRKRLPPGGRLRYALSCLVASLGEPFAMKSVDEVITVSPGYAETLLARYRRLRKEQFTTLPFGAPESDFETLDKLGLSQPKESPGKRIVYIGRGGRDLSIAARLFFSMLNDIRNADRSQLDDLAIEFIGTSYALPGRAEKTIEPIATEYGLESFVKETTARMPYFEALATLRDANGLLILGSDSAAYTPSKIYPYVLARRPILAILHKNSPSVEILRKCCAANLIEFDEGTTSAAPEHRSELMNYINAVRAGTNPSLDWNAFADYTAREMTRKMCAVFDRALDSPAGRARSSEQGLTQY